MRNSEGFLANRQVLVPSLVTRLVGISLALLLVGSSGAGCTGAADSDAKLAAVSPAQSRLSCDMDAEYWGCNGGACSEFENCVDGAETRSVGCDTGWPVCTNLLCGDGAYRLKTRDTFATGCPVYVCAACPAAYPVPHCGDLDTCCTSTAYTSCCTPLNEAQACGTMNCGTVSDGCGGTRSCGSCTAPSTCDTTNHCATCSPLTKAQACGAKTCGTAADGCGGIISCGTCGRYSTCNAGYCECSNGYIDCNYGEPPLDCRPAGTYCL